MSLPEDIARLLVAIDRYNAREVDRLVKFLKQTVAENTYNFEVNSAILKLYQFNPDKYDLETTKVILLQAMAALPKTDFALCVSLLSEEKISHPDLSKLKELHRMLESCQFTEFWTYLREHPELLKCKLFVDGEHVEVQLVGFHDKIREFAAYIVDSAYQHISTALLAGMLGGVDAAQLAAVAAAHGWQVSGDSVFIKSQEDYIKSKNIVENVPFKSVARVMVASFRQ